MKPTFRVLLKTEGGEALPLKRSADGAYTCSIGAVELLAQPMGQVLALSVKATLSAGDASFDPDAALIVRFPNYRAEFVAEAMHGEFWCRPVFGEKLSEVPPRTQALLWRSGKMWRLLWPLCAEQYNCVLSGSEKGLDAQVFSSAHGLREIPETLCLLYTSGRDPYVMLRQAAEAAERLLGGRVRTLEHKSFPKIFDYLGWCSWDAFQIRVNEAGLLQKAEEFKEKQIPVRWCIIDDMWGHVKGLNDVPEDIPFGDMVKIMHHSTLYAMEADPVRFPHGLAGCIEALHKKGFRVGMWYPTTGYWRGLDPEGPAARDLRDCLVTTPNGKLVAAPTPEAATRFHTAMQSMLKAAGADFVKVDNQSHFRNTYRYMLPVGEAARAVHGAIETVSETYFGEGMINCMGMANECMWNRAKSAVCRCSDDFLPENRPWFAKHLLQCAYNSLFQGQFYYSDWDMWWTDDAQAMKNSVCRAISGGPIYVSDKLGRSRKEILAPLCFADGKLLRADGQATPARKCLLCDPRLSAEPFAVFNHVGDCGVLAVFNLHAENAAQAGVFSPADAGLHAGRYLVIEQMTGENFVLERGEDLSLVLPDNDAFRLYLFFPLTGKTLAVGRIDKYLSPAAILRKSRNGLRLYEGGPLALLGVERISTDRRAVVTGEPKGLLTVFDLAPEETEIAFLL